MPLSWNEIRKRAIEFSKEWENEARENAEAKSFWDDFFNVFGVKRKRVATFEERVKKLNNKNGYIDLFWKGVTIVEHKSRGESLDKAFLQAIDYFPGLKDYELPKYILVSDFARFRLYDLDDNRTDEFNLSDLQSNIHLFSFIAGYTKKTYQDEAPVNIAASELMGKLHDALKDNGFIGHPLEVFLVRIMFCLFAEDTGVFEKGKFTWEIENKSDIDGSDLGGLLSNIFQALNTPNKKRQKNLDEDINEYPYINGLLFDEVLPIPCFDSETRSILLECCYFDWSKVSPAIFGSLFQSVMDKQKRSDIGAFYTSEENILKTIKPLFLDELRGEFEKNINRKKHLEKLLDRITNLKFLDPACGCGNFLIITYRELRMLQLDIQKQLFKLSRREGQMVIDITLLNKCIDVDSMYGIEKEEFPARIAQVALWLVDHQANMQMSQELGEYFIRFPIQKAPHIFIEDALKVDWHKNVISKNKVNYILGNPPYIAKNKRDSSQNSGMHLVCKDIKSYASLDYVCAWFIKAAEYIQGTSIKAAFVATNSITQGEQVGILWQYLISRNIKIHFAHRTFKWNNQSSRDAQVFVVIICFANYDSKIKYIFDYSTPTSDAMQKKVNHINSYLVEQRDCLIMNRNEPICKVPKIVFGSMPNDGGHFLFDDLEKDKFINVEPKAEKFFKPFISAREFLHNQNRWCIWLESTKPSEIKELPEVLKVVNRVKGYRLESKREETRKLAEFPYLFGEIRQPNSDYILIPRHSSELRNYIPMGYKSKDEIASDSCCVVPGATLYHFGVLTSSMHMAWVKQVCGRIKSDFRYSNKLVYNNFPWPENPSEDSVSQVEELVKEMFKIRNKYVGETLSDLYNPMLMPKSLLKIHREIDKMVDKCYGRQCFNTDFDRLSFLFGLYDYYISNNNSSNKV